MFLHQAAFHQTFCHYKKKVANDALAQQVYSWTLETLLHNKLSETQTHRSARHYELAMLDFEIGTGEVLVGTLRVIFPTGNHQWNNV